MTKFDPRVPAPAAIDRFAFEPNSIEDALKLCAQLVPTGLLPKHVRSPQAALLQIMLGREHGIAAMPSLMHMHVVNGVPAMATELLAAKVRSSGICDYLRVIEATNERVTVEGKRKDDSKPYASTWTIEDAKRAGLASKENWKNYPKRMLTWRALADVIKALFQDVTMGLSSVEEIIEANPVREDQAPALAAELNATADPVVVSKTEALKDKIRTIAKRSRASDEPGADMAPDEPAQDDPLELERMTAYLSDLGRELTELVGDEAEAKKLWREHVGSTRGKQTRASLQARVEEAEHLIAETSARVAREADVRDGAQMTMGEVQP